MGEQIGREGRFEGRGRAKGGGDGWGGGEGKREGGVGNTQGKKKVNPMRSTNSQ